MNLLIMIRDGLIALALAWVGVTLSASEAQRQAPACEQARCQDQN